MAAADGRADRPVAELLFAPGEAGGWEFWQAVRLLEGMRESWSPAPRRAVRFSSHVGMAFPAADIAAITPPPEQDDDGGEGVPPRMSVNFMGLAGVNGPLPRPFTELALERASRMSPALRDFLDIFNDRLVRMAYEVRKKHRIALSLAPPERTEVARSLFPLAGLGTQGLRRRNEVSGVPDAGILAYTGLIAQQPRSMSGLEGLLTSYFGVPVRGKQLIGRWLAMEPDQRTHLGVTGQNQRLGMDATLGTHFWDQAAAFELRLGPLTRAQYLELLPNGAAHRPLRELTRFYAGTERDFTARLVLQGADVPKAALGQSRLGWTSWLGSYREPVAEVVVRMADTLTFLALGDSYTIGEGVPEARRWPVRLAEMLTERGIAVGAPEIVARTGWTTDELDAAIDEAAPKGPFSLVTLLIGVNNQYRGRPADEYREQFTALLARAIGFAGGDPRRVVVLSIPDWGVTPAAADRDPAVIAREIDEFNAIAREEAKRARARFVDVTAASRAAGAHPGMLAADGLHPSGDAYEEWARLAVPQAMEALTPS